MTNKTITLSRKLAERLVCRESFDTRYEARIELRAALADPVPPADGEPEVYRKPVDYWEGYKGHVCYKDTHDLKKMVHHLESVLDDVPDGELVDRAHVIRLQAEVERLNGMLDASSELFRAKQRVNRALQSELTKARELLQRAEPWLRRLNEKSDNDIPVFVDLVAYLSNQSAPADKDGCAHSEANRHGCPECGEEFKP